MDYDPKYGVGTIQLEEKSSKGKLPPQSLHAVYNSTSNLTGSRLNPDLSESLTLTPRSATAVLKYGFNPEILKKRTLVSFQEEGISEYIQKKRFDAYNNRRKEMMAKCQNDIRKMLELEQRKAEMKEKLDSQTSLIGGVKTLTPEELLEKQRADNAKVVRMEEARMAKMKDRQKRELEAMVKFEVKSTQQRHQLERRKREQDKKEQARKADEKRRRAKIAEDRVMRRVKKDVEEEVHVQKQRIANAEMIARDRELHRQALEKEVEQRKQAAIARVEKDNFIAEQKARLQKTYEDQQIARKVKYNASQGHEEAKQARIHEAAIKRAEEMEEKRILQRERLLENFEAAKNIQEEKKRALLAKQSSSEIRRQQILAAEEYKRMVKVESVDMESQRRYFRRMKFQNDEAMKKEGLEEKFIEADYKVQRAEDERIANYNRSLQERAINKEIKKEVLSRAERIQQFKKAATLKKIQDSDERVQAMIQRKESIVNQRYQQSVKTRAQKERIRQNMQIIKNNAAKATKLVEKAMVPGTDLTKLVDLDSNKPRRVKKKVRKTTAEMLDDLNYYRETMSAGHIHGGKPGFTEMREEVENVKFVSPYAVPYSFLPVDTTKEFGQQAAEDPEITL
jgi:hypothetical protein